MDLEDLYGTEEPPRKKKKRKKVKRNKTDDVKHGKRGFTKKEKAFIHDNYETMKDSQMARALSRTKSSIKNYRIRNNLIKPAQGVRAAGPTRANMQNYVGSLDEFDKRDHFLRELRASPLYKAFKNACDNDRNYIRLYEKKYVEFMMDPNIETITTTERDSWHEMTVAQIRELEYIRKEKEPVMRIDKDGNAYEIYPNYAREISECTKIIQKCQESLNVERKQRLKDGSDQAINFTEVVKELRSSAMRRKAGEEAAMLKYIAERHYNDHLGKNIASGKFDLNQNFKEGKEPEDLDGDFTQEKAFLNEKEIDEKELVGSTSEEEKVRG